MSSYYKIKKEWNNGKWDKEQKGAYTNKQEAINNCTDVLINEGYKVFDPTGNIIFPIYYNETAKLLEADGITSDVEYWSNVFDKKEELNIDYLVTIINRYHEKLNNAGLKETPKEEIISLNNINVIKIPVELFKIKYFDKVKSTGSAKSYANAGYFGGYKENEKYFTLPVANLVCDINLDNCVEESKKYLKERLIENNKLYFAANQNASDQFRAKQVSTICIKSNKVSCRKLNHVNELKQYDYAISGVPIIYNGVNLILSNIKEEGWDSSVLRATTHGFLGIKQNDEDNVYYFSYTTSKSGNNGIKQIQEAIDAFGFRYLLKLDGGGSMYYRLNNAVVDNTSEKRQINNIIEF